jgi:hypothetical protein
MENQILNGKQNRSIRVVLSYSACESPRWTTTEREKSVPKKTFFGRANCVQQPPFQRAEIAKNCDFV